jgi:hypothetical protein
VGESIKQAGSGSLVRDAAIGQSRPTPHLPQPQHLWNQEESGINAFITTSLPLAPAMAKHQMGKMAPAVITTNLLQLASPGRAINSRGSICQHKELLMEVLAKFQTSHSSFMAEPDSQFRPQNLLEVIKSIMNLISPCPEKPLFHFNFGSKAAEKNFLILKRFDLDISQALKAQSLSPLGCGKESRKGNTLFPLLRYHTLWPCMERLLLKGSNWPMTPIPKECIIANEDEAI